MNDFIVQVGIFKSSIKGQIHGIFQLEHILAPEDIRQHKKLNISGIVCFVTLLSIPQLGVQVLIIIP
jgi:hypothetical protein